MATKFGLTFDQPDAPGPHALIPDSRPDTICRSVETSLQRLQTDRIDFYFQHRTDPEVTPEEVASVMASLIKEGKILHWGISECTEEYLQPFNLISSIAEEKHATPSQISMAWMMNKYSWIVPIPRTRHLCRLKENIGAADILLTKEEIVKIDEALEEMEMSEVFGGSPLKK